MGQQVNNDHRTQLNHSTERVNTPPIEGGAIPENSRINRIVGVAGRSIQINAAIEGTFQLDGTPMGQMSIRYADSDETIIAGFGSSRSFPRPPPSQEGDL